MDRWDEAREENGRVDPYAYFLRPHRHTGGGRSGVRSRWNCSQIVLGTDTDSIPLAAADRRREQAPWLLDPTSCSKTTVAAPSRHPQRRARGPGTSFAERISVEGFPVRRADDAHVVRTHKRLGAPSHYEASINLFAYQSPPPDIAQLLRQRLQNSPPEKVGSRTLYALESGYGRHEYEDGEVEDDEVARAAARSWMPAVLPLSRAAMLGDEGPVPLHGKRSSEPHQKGATPEGVVKRTSPVSQAELRSSRQSLERRSQPHQLATEREAAADVCDRLRHWCELRPARSAIRDPWAGL